MQDLQFPDGIHENRIGGSASHLPLENNSVSKMALHCSFEHLEGTEDTLFLQEAARVLSPGGRICIIPLYLYEEYAIQTNPLHAKINVTFDEKATLFCSKNWANRHGRFYDVTHLTKRVLEHCGPLKLKIFVVENGKEIHPSIHTKFIGLFEKKI